MHATKAQKIIAPIVLLLVLLLPLLEIAGFIIVGRWLGVLLTLGLIVGSAIAGIVILQKQGLHNIKEMQQKMAAGTYPPVEALSNSLLSLGALLLIIPGFITDILGLILVIPFLRMSLIRLLIKKGMTAPQPKRKVIDGEFHREE